MSLAEALASMTDPSFTLAMTARVGDSWYQHLDAVENAMAAEDRLHRTRWQAGWSCDEGGWTAPDGTSEYDWALEAYPFPEDPAYQEWADAFWHYERLDNQGHDDQNGPTVSAASGTHPE